MHKDECTEWKKRNLKYHGRKHAKKYAKCDEEKVHSKDHRIIRKWLIKHRSEGRTNRLLDMGCGTGRWFHAMVPSAVSIVGIDFSREMLREAKKKLENIQHTNKIDLLCADIFNLPFKGENFDSIFSVGVLAEHAPLNDEIFEEVWRVLRIGGLFAFTAQKTLSFLKVMMKTANYILPLLPATLKSREREIAIKTFQTRLGHNPTTIRQLAKRNSFSVEEIEERLLTKSYFYFVTCTKIPVRPHIESQKVRIARRKSASQKLENLQIQILLKYLQCRN